ncbi:MAG: alkaline phosphatase family protein [Vicinamibacterales bacterium]
MTNPNHERGDGKQLEDLRQQLRSLGYLDAGVDRFLLAPARGTRGPLAVAARSSVRVGLLGGMLLGPAGALGLGARLPGLISSLRDALVLAVYLAVLFCLLVAATAFLVSAVATAFVRTRDDRFASRARLVSGAAGWSIAAVCLLYLTFWWRNANAGFGWSAPVWTAFALAVAVGISLLLGHAVRITTLGVLAAGGAPAALPRISSTSWGAVVGGSVLAFAGAAVLLVVTAPAAESGATPDRSPLTVVSTGQRVHLVAIDGFDPAIYSQLRDSLPNLGFALGGRRVTLQPQDTSDPARAWTTIATGVTPQGHGVHAIETRRVAGLRGAVAPGGAVARLMATATDLVRLTRPSVVSRDERQAKTIWEVAEEAGLRTGVVNWWATWPAPATGGTVVTDRAVLRLERGGRLDGELAPASIYEPLRAQWAQIRRHAQATAAEAFAEQNDTASILRRSAELDTTIADIAAALPAASMDLFVVYLPGLDIAQNALLGSSAGALAPSAVAARVDALRSYYPFLDRVLGPLVEPAAGRALILVTQPGRVQLSAGGIFALAPVRKDTIAPDAADANTRVFDRPLVKTSENGEGRNGSTPLDVAPTILWSLGLPLSRELAGKPAIGLFPQRSAAVDRYVPAYGRPFLETTPRSGKPLDQEMIDRLRSLGYVK